MFNFLKKKPRGTMAEIEIDGMHCTSCSMTVDGELEDIDGIYCSSTSFAKQVCSVEYDPQKVSKEKIKDVIESLGYKVKKLN